MQDEEERLFFDRPDLLDHELAATAAAVKVGIAGVALTRHEVHTRERRRVHAEVVQAEILVAIHLERRKRLLPNDAQRSCLACLRSRVIGDEVER